MNNEDKHKGIGPLPSALGGLRRGKGGVLQKHLRKSKIRRSILNETRTNSPSGISRCIGGINRALLYIIVSIFIGNFFVGAILGNTPKAKADPSGIDVIFPAPGTVETNMALWIDEGNIEKDCPGDNCVINIGVAVKSPAQYTANLGVGYAPKFVKLIRKLASEQEKEVASVDISNMEENPEQSRVVQLKDSTAVKGKTYEYYPAHVYQKGRNPFVPGDRGGTVYMGPVDGKRTQISAKPDTEVKEFKITKLTNLGCSEEARHGNDLFCDIKVNFSIEDLPFGAVKYEFKVVGGAFKFHGSEYSEPGGFDTFVLNNEEFRNKSVTIGLLEGLSYYQLSLKQEYRPVGPGVIIPTITYTPIVPYIAKKDMVGQSETPEEAAARVGQSIENDPRNPVDANADCKLALFGGDAPFWNPSSWFQDAICEMTQLISNIVVEFTDWVFEQLKKVVLLPPSSGFFISKAYALGDYTSISQQLKSPPADSGYKFITDVWKWSLGLVNVVVIIVLLVIAFSNILRINIDTYVIKKSLPGLVLGVLLANFSLLISRMIVQVSEVLIQSIFIENWAEGMKQALGFSAVGSSATAISIVIGLAGIFLGSTGFGCLAIALGLTLMFLPAIIGIILTFIFLLRKIMIYFLVIISPLAFICLVLPNTQVYFKKWWGMFVTWVFMAPIVFFIFYLISKLGETGAGGTVLGYIMALGLLSLAMTVPFKLGGGLMATWAKIGKVLAKAPLKGFGAIGSALYQRGDRDSTARTVGGLLQKGTRAMDLPLMWATTKKAWGTLEEDRTAVAEREAIGAPLFRATNRDAARTAVARRKGALKDFDTAYLEHQINDHPEAELGSITNGDDWITANAAYWEAIDRLRRLRRLPLSQQAGSAVALEVTQLEELLSPHIVANRLAQADSTESWADNIPHTIGNVRDWGRSSIGGVTRMFRRRGPAGGGGGAGGATPLERSDAQGQMVRYGQYDPTTGEMEIDFNAARGAWGQVAPELGEADAHKVTGFVHAHEAFHDIAANKLSPEARARLTREQEEQLADAYARQALNLGDEQTKARDRTALDDFKAELPEENRGLMDLKYEGEGDNNLLLGLHRAGLEYGKISDKRLSETPTHAVAEAPSPAPAAGSAPALTKEEQEEEVRKNAYIGGVREEYHRETEKIIEKAPEDTAGSKLLDDDKTLRVARLITGRLTVRPNEEQRYNHALYESTLQGAKGAEQKLRVALEQPTVGASKAKVEGIVQAVRTTPAAQLSQKLRTEYQITPEIQARLRPNIQGFTDAVNFKNVVSHRLTNEALDVTQPMRVNLTARLQKGDIDWTGLDRIQSELKTQEQKLSIGRVAPVELDAAYKTLVRIHPAAQIQVEGAKSQPEILSKIKQSRAAIGQLSTPEIRRAMENGGSTQQVEAKIRQNYQAKFEIQHNLDQINKAMSDAVRSVRISRPNLTNEQVSMDLERRVTENVRIKDLIERVTRVDPVYKETVISGVARKIAPQYAKNPNYKIDTSAISQISNQELRRVASAPRPAPRVSIARPASQPIAKPMNDIRPIPEKPSQSQWETQDVKPIIATRK